MEYVQEITVLLHRPHEREVHTEVTSQECQWKENDRRKGESPPTIQKYFQLVGTAIRIEILNTYMTSFISYDDIWKQCSVTFFVEGPERSDKTHIERIVDQVLTDTCEHIQARQDILHVIIHIGEIDFGLVAHVPFDFNGRVVSLGKRSDTIHIVSPETIN